MHANNIHASNIYVKKKHTYKQYKNKKHTTKQLSKQYTCIQHSYIHTINILPHNMNSKNVHTLKKRKGEKKNEINISIKQQTYKHHTMQVNRQSLHATNLWLRSVAITFYLVKYWWWIYAVSSIFQQRKWKPSRERKITKRRWENENPFHW